MRNLDKPSSKPASCARATAPIRDAVLGHKRGLQCLPRGERRRNISHGLQTQLVDFLRLVARRTRANDGARLRSPRPLQATRATRAAEALRIGAEHEIAAELVAAAGVPGAPVVAEPTLEALLRRPPEIQPPAEAKRPILARALAAKSGATPAIIKPPGGDDSLPGAS